MHKYFSVHPDSGQESTWHAFHCGTAASRRSALRSRPAARIGTTGGDIKAKNRRKPNINSPPPSQQQASEFSEPHANICKCNYCVYFRSKEMSHFIFAPSEKLFMSARCPSIGPASGRAAGQKAPEHIALSADACAVFSQHIFVAVAS